MSPEYEGAKKSIEAKKTVLVVLYLLLFGKSLMLVYAIAVPTESKSLKCKCVHSVMTSL